MKIFRGYGFISIMYILCCLCLTKILFRKVRLIRFPIFIRGKTNINFGLGLTTGIGCRIDTFSWKKDQIVFGKNCQINDYVHIAAINKIDIGNNVLVASRVFITDHLHGNYSGNQSSDAFEIVKNRQLSSKPVKIHDNVWIGEGVSILPGVIIGCNTIIGANSVVTKNIPENSIACGIPAKVIKKYDVSLECWIDVKN